MIVVVTGSRDFKNQNEIDRVMTDFMRFKPPDTEFINLCHAGASALALKWIKKHGYKWINYNVDWDHGQIPDERNHEVAMLADELLSFQHVDEYETAKMITDFRFMRKNTRVTLYLYDRGRNWK